MNSIRFRQLEDTAKFTILQNEGTLLATRKFYDFQVQLFTYEGAHYEAWLFIPLNSIHHVELLDKNFVPDFYLDEINLKDYL